MKVKSISNSSIKMWSEEKKNNLFRCFFFHMEKYLIHSNYGIYQFQCSLHSTEANFCKTFQSIRRSKRKYTHTHHHHPKLYIHANILPFILFFVSHQTDFILKKFSVSLKRGTKYFFFFLFIRFTLMLYNKLL